MPGVFTVAVVMHFAGPPDLTAPQLNTIRVSFGQVLSCQPCLMVVQDFVIIQIN